MKKLNFRKWLKSEGVDVKLFYKRMDINEMTSEACDDWLIYAFPWRWEERWIKLNKKWLRKLVDNKKPVVLGFTAPRFVGKETIKGGWRWSAINENYMEIFYRKKPKLVRGLWLSTDGLCMLNGTVSTEIGLRRLTEMPTKEIGK